MSICVCCGGTGVGKSHQPGQEQEPRCPCCHGTGYTVDGGNS